MKHKLILGLILLLTTSSIGYVGYKYKIQNQPEEKKEVVTQQVKETLPEVDINKEKLDKDKEISDLKAQKTLLEKQLLDFNQRLKKIENQVVSKDKEIADLKKTNSKNNSKINDLNSKVTCQELIKQTPEGGLAGYIGVNIEKYYEVTLNRLNEIKINPSRPDDPEDSAAEIAFFEKKLAEAKPMYDNYIKKCK